MIFRLIPYFNLNTDVDVAVLNRKGTCTPIKVGIKFPDAICLHVHDVCGQLIVIADALFTLLTKSNFTVCVHGSVRVHIDFCQPILSNYSIKLFISGF